MGNPFFDHPILNSPYECPQRHWELDAAGQPTQRIVETRRRADFITPIPKPKKRKQSAQQEEMVLDEGIGLSTKQQQYDATSIINEVRGTSRPGERCPAPASGRLPLRRRDSSSIGARTNSSGCVRSSVRSKRRKRPSGSRRWLPSRKAASGCWTT